MEQFVADDEFDFVTGRHFHQPVRHVHRVAGRGNVLITSAAKSRGDDGTEMSSNLEPKTRVAWLRQGSKPPLRADAESCRALSCPESVVRRSLRQSKQDHRAVTQKARDHSSELTASLSTRAWNSFSKSRTGPGPSLSLSEVKPDRSMKITAAFWRIGSLRKPGSRVSHS